MNQPGRDPCLWGDPADALSDDQLAPIAELLAARFPAHDASLEQHRPWQSVDVAPSRLTPPAPLRSICSTEPFDRLLHARGKSYVDVVAARRGEYEQIPDVVALPTSPQEVSAVLEWCDQAGAACVPFGGGTSVVGGVTPRAQDRPVVTLQLRQLDRVLEVDRVSRAAHIQAGATGPVLEEQLRAADLTLRFYPQSFELSTLGGWIATRAAGHFATGPTHIDDVVEAISAITPRGRWSSRRLPASGAGPSPDRWLLGSEGALGVITDAWVRVQPRPAHRAGASVLFSTFADGARAVRAITQADLRPASCRLLDPLEAAINGAGTGEAAVLVLGFESAEMPVDHQLDAALGLCADAQGRVQPHAEDDAAGQWRGAFLRAPYLRDALIGMGVLAETFETATTWDRFDETVSAVIAATSGAVAGVCGDGMVTCRITHAYPDGAAAYFTVVAPARRGSEQAQWREIKAAAAEILHAVGATITHHHAVGRDHREWYDRQRPDLFAGALAAVKRTVDPNRILNPGVLLD